MFSTVDVPDARAVRVYLIRGEDRALIVDPPMPGGWRTLYTRPISTHLDEAAQYLLGQEWTTYAPREYSEIWASFPELLRRYFVDHAEWRRYFRSIRDDSTIVTDAVPNLFPRQIAYVSGGAPKDGNKVRAEAIEVEIWRPEFDVDQDSLRWSLLSAGRASQRVGLGDH